eukprot:CAMPEP_0174842056 /NCGR_PEP_ID=MMETSP1114-20130205/9683_1 /TAXON_ID=312471 /ORGANISM="Neobodo designis, Strain CCAP 1951/1" /LENGTH=58 /DNA_ID=CAMNT_0016076253 /DNA_START=66 /DNA_END=239 /DNA_ORIENTATION=+
MRTGAIARAFSRPFAAAAMVPGVRRWASTEAGSTEAAAEPGTTTPTPAASTGLSTSSA